MSGVKPSATGSCFGFSIDSAIPLNYLRRGAGPTLTVKLAEDPAEADLGRPIVTWTPKPGRPLHARLYEKDDTYLLWIEDGGWYRIDPAMPQISVPIAGDPVRREERLWGLPSALCFLHRGDRSLHAAAVQVDGAAIVLAGPSHHGKTTLAAGFHSSGFRLLTEDLTCYRLSDPPVLIPGPSMLRVRRDVAGRIPLTGVRLIAEDEERSHFALSDAIRGDSSPVPIRAIVLLKDESQHIRLDAVTAVEAIRDLWLLSLHLPNDPDRAAAFEAVSTLSDRIPIWNLTRPTTVESLPSVVEAIARLAQDES